MPELTPTGFELFDHTADIGIRAWAPTRSEVVRPAIQGLYAIIGELVPSDAQDSVIIDVTANAPEFLLRDCLARILLQFERDGCILTPTTVVEFSDRRLVVVCETHKVDETQSIFFREAKAVTYHELAFREDKEGVEVRLIVDI